MGTPHSISSSLFLLFLKRVILTGFLLTGHGGFGREGERNRGRAESKGRSFVISLILEKSYECFPTVSNASSNFMSVNRVLSLPPTEEGKVKELLKTKDYRLWFDFSLMSVSSL